MLKYLILFYSILLSAPFAVAMTTAIEDSNPESYKYQIILNKLKVVKSFNIDEIEINWIDPKRKYMAEHTNYLLVFSFQNDISKTNVVLTKKVKGTSYVLDVEDLPLFKYQKFYVRVFKSRNEYSNGQLFTISHEQIQKSYNWGLFYMASKGEFNIKTDLNNNLIEKQNSPLTLGLFYSDKINKKSRYSASAYFSYFLPLTNASTNSELSIPLEYGFNFYKNTSFTHTSSFTWGMDFEKFSVFNLDEYAKGLEDQKLVSQEILFLTAGYGNTFLLGGRVFFFKLSVSQSILNTGDKFSISDDNYQGQKAIIYGQFNVSGDYYVHGFYKKHVLSGPNDLVITRYGLGLGKKF